MRRLIATVYVADVAYGPESDLPDDVAAQITNPAAWSEDAPEDAPAGIVYEYARINDGGTKGTQAAMDEHDQLKAMSRADLVALAEARGVDSHGSKADLVERLSQG